MCNCYDAGCLFVALYNWLAGMVDIGREGALVLQLVIQILIDSFGIKSLGSVLIPTYYDNVMFYSVLNASKW